MTHLNITRVEEVGSNILFHFNFTAGQKYTIEYRDALDAGSTWTKLLDLAAQDTSGDYTASDGLGNSERFYRIVAPLR